MFFIIIGVVLIFFASLLSIVFGSAGIPFSDAWNAFFAFDSTNMNHQIIWDLRLPRTLGDILVGAAFAVAGGLMQGMTRNPLADSGILGINAGAAFALALSLAFLPSMDQITVVVCSFLGAAFSTMIVYGLTGFNHGKQSPIRLVLAGTAVNTLLAAISQAVALHFKVGQEVTFWTAGSVAGIRMEQILYVAPFILLALILAIFLSPSLSLLSLGEEAAKGLGLKVGKTKMLCMLAVLLLSGSAVSLAGPIAFVGLIIPHIVRKIVGVDYRNVLPCSAILGSLAMLVADVISRLINIPRETPIGLVFAVIGVPFFLYISRKGKEEVHV